MQERIVAAAVRRSVEAAKRQFLEAFDAGQRAAERAAPTAKSPAPKAPRAARPAKATATASARPEPARAAGVAAAASDGERRDDSK